MPVSLIPKRKQQGGVSINFDLVRKNRQIIFVLGIFVFMILAYGSLFFYGRIVNGELGNIETEIKNLREGRDISKENAVLEFDAKLTRLGQILDNHVYSSKLLVFLESITHPKVQFTNFSFISSQGSVTLNGLTESYETFGEQVIALEQNDKIHKLVISDVKLQKRGQVEFALSLDIDGSVYK